MSKVTSKLQLTIPKAIAEKYGICPGDELTWIAAGESIRLEPARHRAAKTAEPLSVADRLQLFDQGSARLDRAQAEVLEQAARNAVRDQGRGWTREELYDRGLPR